MKKYIVKTTAIFHNGKRYGVGEAVELNDADIVAVASYVELDESEAAKAKAEEAAKAKAEEVAKSSKQSKTTIKK